MGSTLSSSTPLRDQSPPTLVENVPETKTPSKKMPTGKVHRKLQQKAKVDAEKSYHFDEEYDVPPSQSSTPQAVRWEDVKLRIDALGTEKFKVNDLRKKLMLFYGLKAYDDDAVIDILVGKCNEGILEQSEVEFVEDKEYSITWEPISRQARGEIIESQNDLKHAYEFLKSTHYIFWDIPTFAEACRTPYLKHLCGVFHVIKHKLQKLSLTTLTQLADLEADVLSEKIRRHKQIPADEPYNFLEDEEWSWIFALRKKAKIALVLLDAMKNSYKSKPRYGDFHFGIITAVNGDAKDLNTCKLYIRSFHLNRRVDQKQIYTELSAKMIEPERGMLLMYKKLAGRGRNNFRMINGKELNLQMNPFVVEVDDNTKLEKTFVPYAYPQISQCILESDLKPTEKIKYRHRG